MNEQLGSPLPWTRTPQPWFTAEASCLLLANIVWAYALLARRWEVPDRERALRVFSAGIVLLASIALVAYLVSYKVPIWPWVVNLPADFGFFANRNQTANVLALSGILVVAIACEDLRIKRKLSALWFGGVIVIGAGLVIDFSRAGILLFFGGTALWVTLSMCFSRARVSLAVTSFFIILLFAVFLIAGGDTLKRVHAVIANPTQDFRIPIQSDAVDLAAQAPWIGNGLGNFEALFRFARNRSLKQDYALHPDSDWLWLAVDLGWVAVAAVLAGVFIWIRRCLPFSSRDSIGLHIAATIYGIGFILAGLVDVSGHRTGTLWPALFVMSMAVNSRNAGVRRRWVAPLFRCLGVALVVIGACWLAPRIGFETFPTSETLVQQQRRIDQGFEKANLRLVVEAATAALRIAPLEWSAYAQRASAEAHLGETIEAIRDFRTARYLQPYFVDLCEYEGYMWLDIGFPEYVAEAWKEALSRAPDGGHYSFGQMLAASASAPSVRDQLKTWALENPEYRLALLESASLAEFGSEIDRLLKQDPHLKMFRDDQRRSLFQTWSRIGRTEQLFEVLLAHPQWKAEEWSLVARHFADEKDYRQAYETVLQYSTKPPLPKIDFHGTRDELERDFLLHSDDLMSGLSLYGLLVKGGRVDDALKTLGTMKRVPSHPRYLPYLEAELHARKQDWDNAWLAWEEFASGNGG